MQSDATARFSVSRRSALISAMTSVPNFTIDNSDGRIVVRSFWRDTDPAQPVPQALKSFVVPGANEGVRTGGVPQKTVSTYTEVVFPLNPAHIKTDPAINGFVYNGFKGVSLVFGFKNRAQNPKYKIQKEEEIKAMLNL